MILDDVIDLIDLLEPFLLHHVGFTCMYIYIYILYIYILYVYTYVYIYIFKGCRPAADPGNKTEELFFKPGLAQVTPPAKCSMDAEGFSYKHYKPLEAGKLPNVPSELRLKPVALGPTAEAAKWKPQSYFYKRFKTGKGPKRAFWKAY